MSHFRNKIERTCNKYTQYRFITSYPGTNTFEECQTIYKGIDILFTTPSKLLEYMRRQVIDTNFVSYLIYQDSHSFSSEEIREIKEIKKHLPLDCSSILYGLHHHEFLKKNIHTTLHVDSSKVECTHFLCHDDYFNTEKKQVIFVESYEDILYYAEKLNVNFVIHQFMNHASQYRIMHEFNKKGGLLIVSDMASRYLSLHCDTVIHLGTTHIDQYMSHLSRVLGVKHSYIYDTHITKKQLEGVVITISKLLFENGYRLGMDAISTLIGEKATRIKDSLMLLGTVIMGGISANYISINLGVSVPSGNDLVSLQSILDGIFPKLLPLLLVLGCWQLMSRKNISVVKMIFILMIGVFVLALCGILG